MLIDDHADSVNDAFKSAGFLVDEGRSLKVCPLRPLATFIADMYPSLAAHSSIARS